MKRIAVRTIVIALFSSSVMSAGAEETGIAFALQDVYCSSHEAAPDTIYRSEFEYSDFRQEYADISYKLEPLVTVRAHINEFAQIWGRISTTDTPVDWPGKNFFAIFKNFDRTKFVAVKFHVPSGVSTSLMGELVHGENLPGPNLTTAISTQCGDFAPSSPFCLTTNQGYSQALARWRIAGGTAPNACELTPGQDYYINIAATDPTAPSPDCSGAICKVNISNYRQQ